MYVCTCVAFSPSFFPIFPLFFPKFLFIQKIYIYIYIFTSSLHLKWVEKAMLFYLVWEITEGGPFPYTYRTYNNIRQDSMYNSSRPTWYIPFSRGQRSGLGNSEPYGWQVLRLGWFRYPLSACCGIYRKIKTKGWSTKTNDSSGLNYGMVNSRVHQAENGGCRRMSPSYWKNHGARPRDCCLSGIWAEITLFLWLTLRQF